MFNWKLSAIAGGIGMVLSLLVGLVSGAGFSHAFVRALVFAVVFFALGSGIWFLLKTFVPDLLVLGAAGEGGADGDGDEMKPGSRINITDDEKILPEVFRGLDGSEEVGDIGELVNGTFKPPEIPAPVPASNSEEQGVDQMPEDGYTESSSQGGQVSGDSPGGLADLDALAGSFLDDGDEEADDFGGQPEPERRPTGNKPQDLQGDFTPKELAKGIQTILKGDE